jgi:hypothetical protein
MICNCSVNPITNSESGNSHTHTRNNNNDNNNNENNKNQGKHLFVLQKGKLKGGPENKIIPAQDKVRNARCYASAAETLLTAAVSKCRMCRQLYGTVEDLDLGRRVLQI